MLFKITKNTQPIKIEIAKALSQNGFDTTVENVNAVSHSFMDQCGIETDMIDAIVNVFGGEFDDYNYDH